MNNPKLKSKTPIIYHCPHCKRLTTCTKSYYVDGKQSMTEIVCDCGKLLNRKEF
ncbi:MAG: hypothetical protein MUP81_06345 [Dehalococcoidia bacterium]|nr:hypothetical protein [Dehalococcoidia bacterium]